MNSNQLLSGAEKSFPFSIVSSEGLDREITDPRPLVHDGTPASWRGTLTGRIVVADAASLGSIPPDINPGTSCLFLSGCDSCPPAIVDFLADKSIPLVISSLEREHLASRLAGLLREKLEYTVCLHGSLVVYRGTGVLVTGESGAGKSRCCLELLAAGAALVADDLVEIKKEDGRLCGTSPGRIRNLIEVRGAGIVDVRALYGESAAVQRAGIDVAFEISGAGRAAGKTSLDIMGIEVPLRTVRDERGKPVSQFVKEACEERCRCSYR
jgi:serine kinase of HPr protein (carbohydrate metabolism regulator)